uniref:Uncharacterized protein n=1 Tax=Anguilla anguilla TaxID=7936 RepID=A0A0E9PYG6_ANGAN
MRVKNGRAKSPFEECTTSVTTNKILMRAACL